MRTYDDLAADLEAMTGDDPEAEHCKADDLLLAAIALAALSGIPPTQGQSNRILSGFTAVRKWYS